MVSARAEPSVGSAGPPIGPQQRTEVAVTGRTGQQCPRSGIWQGDDQHRERIALSLSEVFPPCGGCRRAVNWTLVQPT